MKTLTYLILFGLGIALWNEPENLLFAIQVIKKDAQKMQHAIKNIKKQEIGHEIETETSEIYTPNLPNPPKLYRPRLFIGKPNLDYTLKDHYRKQDLADLLQACDFDNPLVRNTAVKIAGRSPGNFNLGQVCNIYDFCNADWKYVNDPSISGDYLAKASETLRNKLIGDCDDYTITISTLIISIGGEILITYGIKGDRAHAFTELRIGDDNAETVSTYLKQRYKVQKLPGIRKDQEGHYWLNLDWFDDFPGGKYYEWDRGVRFSLSKGTIEELKR